MTKKYKIYAVLIFLFLFIPIAFAQEHTTDSNEYDYNSDESYKSNDFYSR